MLIQSAKSELEIDEFIHERICDEKILIFISTISHCPQSNG